MAKNNPPSHHPTISAVSTRRSGTIHDQARWSTSGQHRHRTTPAESGTGPLVEADERTVEDMCKTED
ncbi:MAG: hypothetical protein IT425_03615 [Pirellulales bacterium]|nr:hypothetical protein [Pirellulales bacterium]